MKLDERRFFILFGLSLGVWQTLGVYLIFLVAGMIDPPNVPNSLQAFLFAVFFLTGLVIIEAVIKVDAQNKKSKGRQWESF